MNYLPIASCAYMRSFSFLLRYLCVVVVVVVVVAVAVFTFYFLVVVTFNFSAVVMVAVDVLAGRDNNCDYYVTDP